MLKSENEDLDALIEAAPLGIVVFDSSAAITRWNPAAEKIFGWKESEVINRTHNPVLPEGNDEPYRQMREKLFSGGSLSGEELVRKRKDGKLIFVKAHTSLLKDNSGRITGVIGMYDDITQKKQEHEKLVWNELLLSQMTESSRNGFYLVDNRNDRILYSNSRFAELWGLNEFDSINDFTNEQLIELCASKVVNKDKFLSSFADLKDINNESVFYNEIVFLDGRTIKYFTTQLKDSNSNYLGRFFMFEDITESKFYEALLKSENDYISSVIKSNDAMIVVDPELKILVINKSAAGLLNIVEEKSAGVKLDNILNTEKFIFKESLSFGKTETFIKGIKLPDGKTLTLEIHVRLQINNKIQLTLNKSGKKQIAEQQRNSFSELQNRFVFTSDIMKKISFELSRLANLDFDVLIEGETGVGKDLAAAQIHLRSKRNKYPFIPVSISSLSDSLIESELFGHEKGAYSGAEKQIIGKFEAADKGILYIPEISTLSEKIQLKLLHFMQYKSISRVGQDARHGEINLDVKLIMATNENLEELVNSGRIRKDFYYRISGTKITIPPLRERKDDIEAIAEYYLEKFSENYPGKHFEFSNDSINMLREYPWNGNVRELVSCIKNVISFCSEPVLEPIHFKNLLKPKTETEIEIFQSEMLSNFDDAEFEFKKKYFRALLQKANNKIALAAKLAGMTPQGLRKALAKLGL